jgi:hypothetical protein
MYMSLDFIFDLRFAKEAPDLMDKKIINSTEIDLIFASSKTIGTNVLTYVQFSDALRKIANKKFPKLMEMRR